MSESKNTPKESSKDLSDQDLLSVKNELDATAATFSKFKEMIDIAITTCQGEGATEEAAKYLATYNNINIWIRQGFDAIAQLEKLTGRKYQPQLAVTPNSQSKTKSKPKPSRTKPRSIRKKRSRK